MAVPALRGKLDSCLLALAEGAAKAGRRGGISILGPICRARWNLAVLSELAEPGRMALVPVVGREGRVSDFMWRYASPTVTLTLGCAGEDLSGLTLTQVLGASALRDALFEICHRTILSRSSLTAAVKVGDWRGRFVAHPSSAGLTGVLTSSSAIRRVIAAQRILRELEEHQGPVADATIACANASRLSLTVTTTAFCHTISP